MNQSVTRLTLDVSVMEKQACISVRQKDTMRRLVFSLVDRGLPYKLEDGVYAAVSVNTLPDTMLYPTVIQDGKVHFDVPADLVQEVNDYTCELILFATDSRVLSTSSFDLIVYHSNAADYNADEAVDSDKFLLMTSATAEALDAAADARNAADLANDAREDAEEAAGRAVEISETLENKLAAGEFKGEKGDTGATGPQGPKGDPGEDGKDYDYGNIRETLEITLKSTDWADNKQTIEANAILENSTVVVNPTEESKDAYIDSGIMLTEAEVGYMVFECAEAPTEDIAVVVHVVDPLITAEPILSFNSVDEMNAYEAEDGAIAIVPSEGDSTPFVDLSDTIRVDTALALGMQGQPNVVVDYPNGTQLMEQFGKGSVRIKITVFVTGNSRQELEVDVNAQSINNGALYQHSAFAYHQSYGLIYLYVQFESTKITYMAKIVEAHNLEVS